MIDTAARPSPTRDRLLAAAWQCVTESGIEGASSRAITRAAGANLAAITYHFGSKERLLAEAAASAIERLITPALAALEDESVDPASRLWQSISRLQEAYEASSADAPAYLDVLLHASRTDGGRLAELLGHVRATLAGVLAALLAEGAIPAWVEPPAMAGLLVAVAEGVVLQTVSDPEGPGVVSLADQFARLLLADRASQSVVKAGGPAAEFIRWPLP